MPYKKSDMVYQDYKWTAKADHDNPMFIEAQERSELNRSEGYEMLHFINSLITTWNWKEPYLQAAHNLEKVIREEVPSNIRTRLKIKQWITEKYKVL